CSDSRSTPSRSMVVASLPAAIASRTSPSAFARPPARAERTYPAGWLSRVAAAPRSTDLSVQVEEAEDRRPTPTAPKGGWRRRYPGGETRCGGGGREGGGRPRASRSGGKGGQRAVAPSPPGG